MSWLGDIGAKAKVGWVALGVGIVAIVGKCADIKLFRARDDAAFRRELWRRLERLEARDDEQQKLIDSQRALIEKLQQQVRELESDLFMQRRLKHACRERLHAAALVIELYRRTGGQHPDDVLELKTIYAMSSDDPVVLGPGK